MTGVSECSQQRGNLKDDGYIIFINIIINYQSNTLERKITALVNKNNR
ncbi:hypothetical protein ABLB90_04355 [Photorhabdus bodei]|uniref:Uncharacterized protein n=2 Tax=Photorhabdus TaxID=29487 RepID=A0ABX0ASK0_9GAMM|nr:MULTISPECIES: hypothetical protein [Photorhabdus]MCC8373952.1 hypothetical protein [Photorhabdus bodei]MDB6367393.1 hypothetical protein [Photorhabdus bodei]MDB6371086.1 hypothetical protein [Photorhabdus bodei]NDL10376.1 hypothetical protein [Photorhabdus kayaii]NDL23752.1 hypothetical protein [Photorhabdus kayaii]